MKLKNITGAALAGMLLVLFLPVFYCVIFIGNQMNYNEEHKITTLLGNESLLLLAVAAAVLVVLLYLALRRLPCTPKTMTAFLVISFAVSLVLYLFHVKVSKCIAFYGGWDCGMVANSARWIYEGGELGYDNYYTVFSNNVPITWLLYRLYSVSAGLTQYPYNPEFIWIQFQCLMLVLAGFFSSAAVLLTGRSIACASITLFLNSVLLGLSPWKIIPYTDAATIAAPVFILFLYAIFSTVKKLMAVGNMPSGFCWCWQAALAES